MKAKYLGLELSSPVIVSSSPYTASKASVAQCVRNGAGAVVLKSIRSEEHTSELQSRFDLVCRLLLEKKKKNKSKKKKNAN